MKVEVIERTEIPTGTVITARLIKDGVMDRLMTEGVWTVVVLDDSENDTIVVDPNGRTAVIDSFLPWHVVPAEHTEARIAAELVTEAAA